jgi:nucleosome binding factor SPN SPT16 subunit
MKKRNYSHENALSKARERRFQAKIKTEDADKLQQYLDRRNITFTEWTRENINWLKKSHLY